MRVDLDTKIKKIISELLENSAIPAEPSEYEKMSGGTVSELYLLKINDSEYVLKLNDPDTTGPEALFLDMYKEIGLLPQLFYVDPSKAYIVYSFLSGGTDYGASSKKEVLKRLVEGLINRYVKVPSEWGWGWLDSPSVSWQDFLRGEVSYAKKTIGSSLGQVEHKLAAELVEMIEPSTESYLLHGDCGFHNFIFSEKQLTGVIDPAPVIGVPLYDLIYAFFSTPEDLSKETFDYAIHWLKEEPSEIYELVLIGLYLRMALCTKHHPEDLPEYMKVWSEWLAITEILKGRQGEEG